MLGGREAEKKESGAGGEENEAERLEADGHRAVQRLQGHQEINAAAEMKIRRRKAR